MANTRIDRLPLAPPFYFYHQESHSLLDGESSSPSRPSSSRSSRPSPKKGRLFGPGNLGKTTEEEQQDLDPSEITRNPSEPTPVPAIVEEDTGSGRDMVISVSRSPPHETKMRQISEGVHGIEKKKADPEDDGHAIISTSFPPTEDAVGLEKSADHEQPPSETPDPQPETPPPIVDPPAVIKDPSVPPDRPKRRSSDYLLPFPGMRGSDSSVEQEKGLKRKLGDRAVSESREAESTGKKASKKDVTDEATTCVVGTKRARDGEGMDPNPKEAKRPSPPPDKIVKAETEKPPVISSSGVVNFCISDAGKLVDSHLTDRFYGVRGRQCFHVPQEILKFRFFEATKGGRR